MRTRACIAAMALACVGGLGSPAVVGQTTASRESAPTTRPQSLKDANGNALRVAKTGHVSNYDEAKVGVYTLPDPLKMAGGAPVNDAKAWASQRRPEILGLYEREIYGSVPANAPTVHFDVLSTGENSRDGKATIRRVEGKIGGNGPVIHLVLVTPAGARGPLPVVLNLSFSTQDGQDHSVRPPATTRQSTSAPVRMMMESAPINGILDRGFAYVGLHYTDIQPDAPNTFTKGVIGMTLNAGETQPAPDQWGTISAWAWGVSRVVDYLQTDGAVDGKRIAIVGHSRLGKTVLWAGAQDRRIALVFSSCAGEMGSALARRDFGESVDDMAQNYGYQFAGNLQKYSAHWNDMPVDAHMLLSLIAPRPLLVTGGSKDLWSDPHGEFLSCVAASPVYQLLGAKGIGTDNLPSLDQPVAEGDIAFEEHAGLHMITPGDWNIFLDFANRYLHPVPPPTTAP